MSDKYMLRVNDHFYDWVDAPDGVDKAIDDLASRYAAKYQCGEGCPIVVDVLDVDHGRSLGTLPDKVLESVTFEVSLTAKRKKGQ